MDIEDTSVSFWPVFGSKTDKGHMSQSGWRLLKNEDSELDSVYWTQTLINVASNRLEARPDLFNLFITTRGRATIAGWVKTAFVGAGVNYSPGSIRSAVSLSRLDSEVQLDTVLRNCNWKGKTNFFKYYYKGIERSHFPGYHLQ